VLRRDKASFKKDIDDCNLNEKFVKNVRFRGNRGNVEQRIAVF